MDFLLSSEQEALRDTIQRVLADHYNFQRRGEIVAAGGFDRGMWKQFAELGWLMIPIAADRGGLEGTPEDKALIIEELSRGLVVEPVAASMLAASLLARSETQYAIDLAIAAGVGDIIAVPALLERGKAHEGLVPACAAAKSCGRWRLDGRKLLSYGAPVADRFIVSADIPDAGIGLFGVATGPGVTVRAYRTISGTSAGDVEFTAAPAELLLQGNAATQAIESGLDEAAVMACAAALGAAERAMALASEYVSQRIQFKQPLSRFQVIQHRIADMFIETQIARGQLHSGILGLRSKEPLERVQRASAAKYHIPSAAKRVAAQGIQLHGGMGMAVEHEVGHHYRHAVELEQMWGGATFHLHRYSSASGMSARVLSAESLQT